MTHYEVVSMVGTPGWVMVGDMSRPSMGPAVALFMEEFADVAQEMADRLNLRVAVGKLTACPTCSRPADQVNRWIDRPAEFVHEGPYGRYVHHDGLADLTH
jgi:4-hydroxy-3-methylbut-2-en-1-yl diphosphate synthase IspG/GcpE